MLCIKSPWKQHKTHLFSFVCVRLYSNRQIEGSYENRAGERSSEIKRKREKKPQQQRSDDEAVFSKVKCLPAWPRFHFILFPDTVTDLWLFEMNRELNRRRDSCGNKMSLVILKHTKLSTCSRFPLTFVLFKGLFFFFLGLKERTPLSGSAHFPWKIVIQSAFVCLTLSSAHLYVANICQGHQCWININTGANKICNSWTQNLIKKKKSPLNRKHSHCDGTYLHPISSFLFCCYLPPGVMNC